MIVIPVTNTGSVPFFLNNFEIPGSGIANGYFFIDYTVPNACLSGAGLVMAPGASCVISMQLVSYTSVGSVTAHLLVHGFAFDGTGVERAGYGHIVQTIN